MADTTRSRWFYRCIVEFLRQPLLPDPAKFVTKRGTPALRILFFDVAELPSVGEDEILMLVEKHGITEPLDLLDALRVIVSVAHKNGIPVDIGPTFGRLFAAPPPVPVVNPDFRMKADVRAMFATGYPGQDPLLVMYDLFTRFGTHPAQANEELKKHGVKMSTSNVALFWKKRGFKQGVVPTPTTQPASDEDTTFGRADAAPVAPSAPVSGTNGRPSQELLTRVDQFKNRVMRKAAETPVGFMRWMLNEWGPADGDVVTNAKKAGLNITVVEVRQLREFVAARSGTR